MAKNELLERLIGSRETNQRIQVLPIVCEKLSDRLAVALRYRAIVTLPKPLETSISGVPIFVLVRQMKSLFRVLVGAYLLLTRRAGPTGYGDGEHESSEDNGGRLENWPHNEKRKPNRPPT